MKTLFIYIDNTHLPIQARVNNNPACTVTCYNQWQTQVGQVTVCYVEHTANTETKLGSNDDFLYHMAISG